MSADRKRVVLVGGSGFVGRNLATALATSSPSLSVSVSVSPSASLSPSPSGFEVLLLDVSPCPPELESHAHITHARLDMTDSVALRLALQQFRPHIVVDIAGWGMSGPDMLNGPRCQAVNVLGTQRLLQACVDCDVQRLVYTSTYNVVFSGRKEIDGGSEDGQAYVEDCDHMDQYSKSKTRAEKLVLQANGSLLSNGQKMITAVIRPAAIYGENEQRHMPRILTHLDMGMMMFRIGCAKVDWVHVDNLVLAYVLLVDKLLLLNDHTIKPAGRPYFISDGSPIDNFEFLRPLCVARGRDFPETIVPVQLMFFLSTLFEAVFYTAKLFGVVVAPPLTRAEVAKVGVTHNFSMMNAEKDFGYVPKFNSVVGAERLANFYKGFPQSNFFQFAHWTWFLLVWFGMILLALAAFTAVDELKKNIFLDAVYQVGVFIFQSQWGLQLLFYCAVLVHFLEAVFAAVIASRLCPNTIGMWFVQTFLLGYPSLRIILKRSHDYL